MQRQTAVTASLKRKQLPLLAFALPEAISEDASTSSEERPAALHFRSAQIGII